MIENSHDKLDQEWVNLIKEAKEIGLSVEELRAFLQGKIKIEQLIKESHVLKID